MEALDRGEGTLPLDAKSPASPLYKKQRRAVSAPSAADLALLQSQRRISLVSLTGSGPAAEPQGGQTAAASGQPDIGPLGEWLPEVLYDIYGELSEIQIRQQAATAPLARKAIATGTVCWGDERDSVLHVPDPNKQFDGLDVSSAVKEAAKGDPRRPKGFYHFISMLQGFSPAIAAQFVGVFLNEYKTKNRIVTTLNWQNQTYFEDLGRKLTPEEFGSAYQVPWEKTDNGSAALLLREAHCVRRGKIGGGGPFLQQGQENSAGRHNAERVNVRCDWPDGVEHNAKGWNQFKRDNDSWRQLISFQDVSPDTMAGRLFQVLEGHNLDDFAEGLWYVFRIKGSFAAKGRKGDTLLSEISYMPHSVVLVMGPLSRVKPLDVAGSGYPVVSHTCRTSAGTNCMTSGCYDYTGKLAPPEDWIHESSPLVQHVAYYPDYAAEAESDACGGVVVEVFYKNGTFIITHISYCGLLEHRGYHPTGVIASACGKLVVRTSPLSWQQLRRLAPSEQARKALDELVGEGSQASSGE